MNKSSSHRKQVYLVRWKRQKDHVEIFNTLETFAASYPRYNLSEIANALSFGNSVFEDNNVHIEKKAIVMAPKPDLPRRFFWEFNYDQINWKEMQTTVIQRILERGSIDHWQELVRYYGTETILTALKEKITFMLVEVMDETSKYFNLPKKQMLCYQRKQSLKIWFP